MTIEETQVHFVFTISVIIIYIKFTVWMQKYVVAQELETKTASWVNSSHYELTLKTNVYLTLSVLEADSKLAST